MITLEMLEPYWAKPDERLDVHTNHLLQRARVLKDLNYIDNVQYTALIHACMTHDVGKILKHFQFRVQHGTRFDGNLEVPHNILSAFFVDIDGTMDLDSYLHVAYAVINHHHYENFTEVFRRKTNLLNSNLALIVEELQSRGHLGRDITVESLNDVLDDYVLGQLSEPKNESKTSFIMAKGLLHKCDYSASAHIPIELPNDFTTKKLAQLAQKFAAGWNPLQQYCQLHSDSNLIVIAPTGMGKTEAALLWQGDYKGFYVLPLRTAINSMYQRLRTSLLQDECIEQRLAILHGDSLDVYINESSSMDTVNYTNPYYRYNLAKNMSMPITVTTPDQVFDFVFKYLGHEVKLATYSYSKIIIDEIQAYSADVLCYVIYGLQCINQLGGKFSIFTATLPPFVRDLLQPKNDLVESRSIHTELVFKTKTFTHNQLRHHLHTIDELITAQSIAEYYKSTVAKHGVTKALVVCNIVKKAQQLYDELIQVVDSTVTVKLLHARFIKRDRTNKEAAILADGQTYLADGKTLNRQSVIWVTTQLVEASLDIDFDLLFTELSDLNGLFQRLGRCNRKAVKPIDDVNCYIYMNIDPKLLKSGTGHGFIDQAIYQLSYEALQHLPSTVLSESDKQALIDQYLTLENLVDKNSYFIKEYKEHYDFVDRLYIGEIESKKEVVRLFRNIISHKVIPVDVFKQNRAEFDSVRTELSGLNQVYSKLLERLKSKQISQSAYDQAKETLKIDRRNLKRWIEQFSLSIQHYDFVDSRVVEYIEISDYEKLAVINCEYDSDLGYRRKPSAKKESTQAHDQHDGAGIIL